MRRRRTWASIIGPIVATNIHRESVLMITSAPSLQGIRAGDAYTNAINGYFSILKRGMKDICQHCFEKHPHRYLAEFDFRYNERGALSIADGGRTIRALSGIVGKRLTYRDSSQRP
jgi:hypothetical protein